MEKLRLGLAMCGSYCTYAEAVKTVALLGERYELFPIMSETAARTDTRFGKAEEFIDRLEKISGKPVIMTIADAEPLGPTTKLDALLIAPCTGNTLAKLANGITDSCVTMAAKATLRNGKPVVFALSTNDGLSGSAQNIGRLLARKNVFFVPFLQDDPEKKPSSLMADWGSVERALEAAVAGRQLQPILV
jgi:dipicolinate synthase subunit B